MHFTLPDYEYETHRVTLHRSMKIGEWNTLAELEGPGIIKHLWFTFPAMDRHVGRKNIIRIYWDDEEEPSVETPLGDFFGIPMGMAGSEFQINSYFIQVAPNNGMNSYFPMPFARKAKVQILMNEPTSAGGFYFQCDYEKCTNGLPAQWKDLRFHAKYRMESPTESYGHRYLAVDAEGEGYLVGTTFGIRVKEQLKDAWYHGGGDLITIDGETNPHILHGIGAEDFFGHSWGTGKSSGLYLGNPFIEEMAGEDRYGLINLGLYRFFVKDPIRFKSSLRVQLGALGANMSSVAYWYQKGTHRPFFTMPPVDKSYQTSEVRRGEYDIDPDYTHEWQVFGPIKDDAPHAFADEHPLEKNQDLAYEESYEASAKEKIQAKWQELDAPRGFMDFHVRMRPVARAIRLQTNCYGYGLGYVELEEDFKGKLRIGFDDQIKVWINDEVVFEGDHPQGFCHQTIPVTLPKGKHKILFKLSNAPNINFRAWVSHFSFLDESGNLRPDLLIKRQ